MCEIHLDEFEMTVYADKLKVLLSSVSILTMRRPTCVDFAGTLKVTCSRQA